MKELWIVWDNYDGMICIDEYESALKEYEKQCEIQKDYVNDRGEFESDERVVLAKIQKDFYSYDTKENGKGYVTSAVDTYWDWKEDKYFN